MSQKIRFLFYLLFALIFSAIGILCLSLLSQ